MNILKGKPVSEKIDSWVTHQTSELKESGITPKLGIVRVGKREDDIAYERSVLRKCKKVGIDCEVFEYEESISDELFQDAVRAINMSNDVHGILMFRPLPEHIDQEEVTKLFRPEKDIDGILPCSLGSVLMGSDVGFAPCTAESVFEILKHYEIPLRGSNVAVVNCSNVVGKPLAMMLANGDATPTVCHIYTRDIKQILSGSDIVVTAIGKAKHFTKDYLNNGQIVIDVGINVDEDGCLCGDVDYNSVVNNVSGITPVPGGVGGVTASILLRNVVTACKREREYSLDS